MVDRSSILQKQRELKGETRSTGGAQLEREFRFVPPFRLAHNTGSYQAQGGVYDTQTFVTNSRRAVSGSPHSYNITLLCFYLGFGQAVHLWKPGDLPSDWGSQQHTTLWWRLVLCRCPVRGTGRCLSPRGSSYTFSYLLEPHHNSYLMVPRKNCYVWVLLKQYETGKCILNTTTTKRLQPSIAVETVSLCSHLE